MLMSLLANIKNVGLLNDALVDVEMTSHKNCSQAPNTRFSWRNALIASLLFAIVFVLPRPALSQMKTVYTISSAANLAATLLSLMNSGANSDPIGIMILQNRRMIESIHLRLSAHDKAFKLILEKIDDLPSATQREINKGFDIDQIRRVNAIVQTFESGMKTYKQLIKMDPKNSPKPVDDLTLLLHDLKIESRKLLQHNSDLILFDALAAMNTEMAILAMQPEYNDDQLSVMMNNVRKEFHQRFKAMLIPWSITLEKKVKQHYESLPELISRTSKEILSSKKTLDSILQKKNNYYYNIRRFDRWCCGQDYDYYDLNLETVEKSISSFSKNLKGMEHMESKLGMYRTMRQVVRQELNHHVDFDSGGSVKYSHLYKEKQKTLVDRLRGLRKNFKILESCVRC